MKKLLSLMVLGSVVALAAPAYADPKPPATEAECNKTEGYDWDKATGKCVLEFAWRLVAALRFKLSGGLTTRRSAFETVGGTWRRGS